MVKPNCICSSPYIPYKSLLMENTLWPLLLLCLHYFIALLHILCEGEKMFLTPDQVYVMAV